MRKRKSNVKKISLKTIVLIILFIFFITISVGYSYLKQSLSMTGKSTIVQEIGNSGQIINGDSTYTWTEINSWGGGGSNYIYQVKIELFNRDADITKWQLSFDVPDSYDDAASNIWVAESRLYENGRLTLYAHGWNASVATGATLTLEFQLAFKEQETELMTNFELIDASLLSPDENETTTPDSGETEDTTQNSGDTSIDQTDNTTQDSVETNTEQPANTVPEIEDTNASTSPIEENNTQTSETEQTDIPVTNE